MHSRAAGSLCARPNRPLTFSLRRTAPEGLNSREDPGPQTGANPSLIMYKDLRLQDETPEVSERKLEERGAKGVVCVESRQQFAAIDPFVQCQLGCTSPSTLRDAGGSLSLRISPFLVVLPPRSTLISRVGR